ncbi:diaminopropionate ammonia-lyase [Catenuloplanes japonicus]|uniref:diaminopropionate ammonia-lyase n=1 Tax=Catenuloplanes japonicus TaxID=33876 RepID=UPI0005244542|nr:diaminopropionate ammonia-lyase [Catenuloplanes japonicus]
MSLYLNDTARSWRCARPGGGARAFHEGLPGYAPTPLLDLPDLAAACGVGRMLVKDESYRLGLPAFKILGASWATARLIAARADLTGPLTLDALKRAAGALTLVTATDGNHGRAVARMAALLGLPARMFLPAVATDAVVAAIAGEGARVTRIDGDYDEAVRRAAADAAADPDAVLVQDTAWPGYTEIPSWIVEGYETLFAEITASVTPDLIVVPVGVGSLAQAAVAHVRGNALPTVVLGVEPDTAACTLASLEAGEPVTVPTADTIMAGLNCGTVSAIAWPFLRDGLDAAVTVTDADAARAVADLPTTGPSGASTLAAARALLADPQARARLGLGPDATVVLLGTEAAPAAQR